MITRLDRGYGDRIQCDDVVVFIVVAVLVVVPVVFIVTVLDLALQQSKGSRLSTGGEYRLLGELAS